MREQCYFSFMQNKRFWQQELSVPRWNPFMLYHNYLAFSNFLCVLQISDLTTSCIIFKGFIVLTSHRSWELQGRSFISGQSIYKSFPVPFSLLVSPPFSRIIHTPLKISVSETTSIWSKSNLLHCSSTQLPLSKR